jgi:alkanesulfonate monooxygenase SsuD/methylene tetrahydromethanopterin reductase-like flavin-dependent oxidoreductase (luciferase family)
MVLRDPLPWTQCLQVIRAAEDTGYEAAFVPETTGREAFATLAGFAMGTSRIRIGSGVVTVLSRSPVATAMGAATVQDLSGGRMVLGIGAGNIAARTRRGESSTDPIAVVRAFVRVVADALAKRAPHADDAFGGAQLRLTFLPDGGPPPIWLAALGDRMIELAGEVADGVILNWCTPERVREARQIVDRVAGESRRPPGSVTVAVYVRACLGVDEAVAEEALAEMTGQYASIPQYLRQLRRMGLGQEGEAAARAHRAGRPGGVPESLVRTLTVMGGREAAMDRFHEYFDAGADLVLCYPVSVRDPFSSILGTVLAAAPSPALER